MGTKKADYVVVDTNAFIKNAPLQEISDNIMTIQEVIDEVKCKRHLRNLIVLPYDLIVKDVFSENIKFITEFSKKTGDYMCLSATDIKVIALTYQLEKEKVGTEHLRTEPVAHKTILKGKVSNKQSSNKCDSSTVNDSNAENFAEVLEDDSKVPNDKTQELEGTVREHILNDSKDKDRIIINADNVGATDDSEYAMQNSADLIEKTDTLNVEAEHLEGDKETKNVLNKIENEDSKISSDNVETMDNSKDNALPNTDDLMERFGTMNVDADDLEDNEEFENVLVKIESTEAEKKSGESSSGSDDEGWITPGNIKEKIKELDTGTYFEDKVVKVACITTDFAMQNVLMQIGLNVSAYDGRMIKQLRTFIFRCTTCFKTTSVMTKVFCPNCGHKSLKRVSVRVDEQGRQHIHINTRRPLTNRGKRYSLPTPKGGQHAQYPLLVEDQQRYKSKQTKLAQEKNHPMEADYIAGYSPFVMRDVNSRAAVLGVRNGKQEFKYWMRKNPNEVMRKRK